MWYVIIALTVWVCIVIYANELGNHEGYKYSFVTLFIFLVSSFMWPGLIIVLLARWLDRLCVKEDIDG
jgi:ABC-type Co2+ transport system permease subunit